MVQRLRGQTPGSGERTIRGKLATNVPSSYGIEEYVRATIEKEEGSTMVRPIFAKSSVISTLSKADGYFVVPEGQEGLEAGVEVEVFPLLRKRYLDTISKEEALKRVLAVVNPLEETEVLTVPDCRGRITAEPVRAKLSNPPFTCAAMDGYAVDFEQTLEADLTNPVSLMRDTQTKTVNTGDPLPPGMNAVIMAEDAEGRARP